jgi:hypothetical protein
MRQIPPQLALNLNNLVLPQLKMPEIPAGIDPDAYAAMVQKIVNSQIQPTLNEAVKVGVQELLKALPTVGFEQLSFNGGWHEEE